MRFFKDLADLGHFDNNNAIYLAECLRFGSMVLNREELYKVAKKWNLHN